MDRFIQNRRKICRRYDSFFTNLKTVTPLKVNYDQTAPFMYILRVFNDKRELFIDSLKKQGVDTGIHYIPNHIHPFFKKYVREPLARSTALGEQIVTLPLLDLTPVRQPSSVMLVIPKPSMTTPVTFCRKATSLPSSFKMVSSGPQTDRTVESL